MPSNNDRTPPYEYKIEDLPSITIARAIADIEDKKPTNLEITLHNYIDTEALDRLCTSDETQIKFDIDQYEIRVIGSDMVQLWP